MKCAPSEERGAKRANAAMSSCEVASRRSMRRGGGAPRQSFRFERALIAQWFMNVFSQERLQSTS